MPRPHAGIAISRGSSSIVVIRPHGAVRKLGQFVKQYEDSTVRALVVLAIVATTAHAGEHIVQRGETLEHVAQQYGCSVEQVLRANNLKTTLVKPGTVVRVPACSMKARARSRDRITARRGGDDERARQALAIIDGTTLIAGSRDDDDDDDDKPAIGERLPTGEGYRIRRPNRAFGAPHVVEHLKQAIALVRALYPDVHTLAIGDISAEHGGKLANHLSHRTGLDVDVGFFFHTMPEGYPDKFVAANADLDLEATWALLTAFARTQPLDDGVQMIFLDYDIQARLHAWARKRGTPDEQLAQILQYPRGEESFSGLVRHWPNHTDHMHVRFKAAK
jgi:LysM repeat protein